MQTMTKCSVEVCDRSNKMVRGLCWSHYVRSRNNNGDPGTTPIGPPNTKGSGNGWIDGNGYRVIVRPGHPNCYGRDDEILEHRYVMSEELGRPLRTFENVHHKNGNRTDNRPENLELWITSQPKGQRPEDLVEWATEILELYGPGA